MTYSYVAARVLPYTAQAQWEDVDLHTRVVSTIFGEYKFIVLTLNDGENDIFVDLNQLRPSHNTYANTLTVLLQSLGNTALVTTPQLPAGIIDYIQYSDFFRLGYLTTFARSGINLPDNYPLGDLEDLEITRPNYDTNMELFHRGCLVTTNGFIHNTDTDGTRAWIVDGGKTIRKKASGYHGLISFFDVGELHREAIPGTALLAVSETDGLKGGLTFTTTLDTTDKFFFLVLGGYIVLPQEGFFFKTGDNTYRLNFQLLPYLERLMESYQYLDLSSLGLTESELNSTMINVDEAKSDEVIQKYFDMSQSFFVMVDRKNVFSSKQMLNSAKIPGHYSSYLEPQLPLIAGHGFMPEYWKVNEGGYWAITVIDGYQKRWIWGEQPENQLVNVTDQLSFSRTHFNSQGQMLQIGAYPDTEQYY